MFLPLIKRGREFPGPTNPPTTNKIKSIDQLPQRYKNISEINSISKSFFLACHPVSKPCNTAKRKDCFGKPLSSLSDRQLCKNKRLPKFSPAPLLATPSHVVVIAMRVNVLKTIFRKTIKKAFCIIIMIISRTKNWFQHPLHRRIRSVNEADFKKSSGLPGLIILLYFSCASFPHKKCQFSTLVFDKGKWPPSLFFLPHSWKNPVHIPSLGHTHMTHP